jgi:hypothetical protein
MTAIKNIPPNRTVALLTPLVFAPLAGAISVAAAKYLPGVTIDEGSLEAVFIAGATIALGPAGMWLKGWQAHEQRDAAVPAATVGPGDFAADPADPLDGDADGFALDLAEDGEDLDLDLDLDFDEDEDDELMALSAAPEA